jgi:hypothetical protein
MQPNSTNGVQVSAHDMLESLRSLRLAIEKLETELREQKQQNEELKRSEMIFAPLFTSISRSNSAIRRNGTISTRKIIR